MSGESYSRKLDNIGRIMIPAKLREKVGLILGEEYTFSVFKKGEKLYIAIDCTPNKKQEE